MSMSNGLRFKVLLTTLVSMALAPSLARGQGVPLRDGFAAVSLSSSHADTLGFCFKAAVNYAVAGNPYEAVAADLDGDHDADLAVANNTSNNVSVLMNNGDGTYAVAVNYIVGISPWSVTAADLDGDGDQDLAVANWGSNTVSVLMNNGDGTFAAAVNYVAGSAPHRVRAADLDGDGDQDLAVANSYSSNVSVLMNNGNGIFAAAVNYAVGGQANCVVAADLDKDGDQDLVSSNWGSNNVSVLLNNGDGTFADSVNYAVGDHPYSVFAADLDGDNDADLAVANSWSDNVSVLKNNGDGTFAEAVNYAAGGGPHSIVAADLDGDGDADLAVANWNSANVSMLENNGDGTFAAAVNYATGSSPSSVFAADLDGDNDADLAVANYSSADVSVLINCQNQPPNAACQNVAKSADANCQATVTPAEVNNGSSDPEDGTNVTLELVPPGPFAKGATPVKLIVTDTQGAKDTCDATVTVLDTTPPNLTCPGDIVRANDPGQCGAVVDFVPVATDNCFEVTVVSTPPSGSFFPVDVTAVTCIATDAAGNADTCVFTVTVNDTAPPVANCHSDTIVDAVPGEAGANVIFSSSGSDNCQGAVVRCDPPSGSFFPGGTTHVTCIASDPAGNTDTCGFSVTVHVCICLHQGDIAARPTGDGVIDVFDVIELIDIAFSGGVDILDPDCPRTRGDVDNNGVTDVFDVIYLIATAFSGGPPPVEPCTP